MKNGLKSHRFFLENVTGSHAVNIFQPMFVSFLVNQCITTQSFLSNIEVMLNIIHVYSDVSIAIEKG